MFTVYYRRITNRDQRNCAQRPKPLDFTAAIRTDCRPCRVLFGEICRCAEITPWHPRLSLSASKSQITI